MTKKNPAIHARALRMVASSTGIVAGIAGMEHGLLETLQGNQVPAGNVIESIGAAQRFWTYGSEPAFTLIPNYFVTGIVAMIVSLLIIVWSAAFVEKKYGALVLACLSIAMFLTGGGFAPPVFAIVAIMAALFMRLKFKFLRTHCPQKLLEVLSKPWKIFLALFIALSSIEIVTAIFGYPLLWFFHEDNIISIQTIFGYTVFFGLGPIVMITSVAHDIKK